jgi:hypothetical protein
MDLGYFGYNGNYKAYIEVISFDRLLNLAHTREIGPSSIGSGYPSGDPQKANRRTGGQRGPPCPAGRAGTACLAITIVVR